MKPSVFTSIQVDMTPIVNAMNDMSRHMGQVIKNMQRKQKARRNITTGVAPRPFRGTDI